MSDKHAVVSAIFIVCNFLRQFNNQSFIATVDT